MRSMHPPADAGQLCAELLADFAQAQQRLYSPQVEAVLHTPRAESLALIAAANCLRAHVEDLTGERIPVADARQILHCTLDCLLRALDQAKGMQS